MEQEYISKIVLELQPRSRRGFRCLFGIRENKYLDKKSIDIINLTENFLKQYNNKVLQRGQHIKLNNLIISIKQIKRACELYCENTQVEFRLKGVPLKKEIMENKGRLNESFINDSLNNCQGNINISTEQVYSCYCSECKKCLNDGDFYIKSGNWSRPILCLNCYEISFTYKCTRCTKSITFDNTCLTSDGLSCIRFVEHNGLYWHSDCCVCVKCLESLIGKKFYQDQIYNQLFCLEHIPNEME